MLLKRLARDVERQGVGVDDTLDEAQILGQELIEFIGDEDASNVQLESARAAVVVVVVIRRRALRNVEDGFELDVALSLEVRVRERFFRVLRERLVELGVLFFLDLGRRSEPDSLDVVETFPIPDGFGNRLGLRFVVLGVVLGVIILVLVLVRVFIVVVIGGRVGGFIVPILRGDFLGHFLGVVEVDGEVDEFGVALHQRFELGLFEVLLRLFLEVDVDLDAATERFALVLGDGKVTIRARLPDPLLVVVVVLGANLHKVGDQVHRVESDTELADERHVAALGHLVQERGRSGLGDRAQVVHQVILGHADASIANREHLLLLISLDANVQVGVITLPELTLVRQRHESNLIQRIRSVRDQLSQEDVLVRVQRVDDDVHQSRHFGLKLKLFRAGVEFRHRARDRRLGIGRIFRAHCSRENRNRQSSERSITRIIVSRSSSPSIAFHDDCARERRTSRDAAEHAERAQGEHEQRARPRSLRRRSSRHD